MKIVVLTHQARYEGSVTPTSGSQAIRLQEMLNNPAVFTAGNAIPANHIRLENVKIRFSPGQEVLHDERPVAYINPSLVESAYETSHTLETRSGLAVYERHHLSKEEARVQIITSGWRRVTGVLLHGLRTLTYPAPEHPFFALVDVELEEFHPEPATIRINFILLNQAHIESFVRTE